MKTQIKIFCCILWFFLAGKSASQTFTIDSMKIDEVNNELSVYSKDLDFNRAKIFIANVPLFALHAAAGGFLYQLPDSGNGSAGNITIFSHGAIDTNWMITRWTEDVNFSLTVPDSLYFSGHGMNYASYPHIQRASYHFILRTATKMSSENKNTTFPHLNRSSSVLWDFNDFLVLPGNFFEVYTGSGNLPVDMSDSTNDVFFGKDSMFFSYASLKDLACSYSYYYEAREKIVYDSGHPARLLDRQYFGIKLNNSGSLIFGKISFKKDLWGPGSHDSLITASVSWSNLTSESPYVNPSNLTALSTHDITYTLSPNYPNPFSSSTTIPFAIGKSGYLSLEIVDMLGRKIAVLAGGSYEPGSYEAKFNRDNLAAGMYFVRLLTENRSFIKPMVITR